MTKLLELFNLELLQEDGDEEENLDTVSVEPTEGEENEEAAVFADEEVQEADPVMEDVEPVMEEPALDLDSESEPVITEEDDDENEEEEIEEEEEGDDDEIL